MRLGTPQALEQMHHERGGDYRGDEVDKRHNKQSRDHHTAEKHASGKAMACRSSRCSVEPSQRDHLEILAAEKISARAEENKKFSRPMGK